MSSVPPTEDLGAAIHRWTNDIHQGDAAETLSEMPENSVHCVMTSPPYFGQRDYEVNGQIGLEESLDEYIGRLLDVAEELSRVLRDDGSWWLNLGDTYGGDSIVRSDGDWTRPGDGGYEEAHSASYGDGRRGVSTPGRKNKMLVPHRTAIALQDAGWVVRTDAPWVKDMPDPASDRLRRGPEYVFHLTQKPDYWANSEEMNRRGWFDLSQGQFSEGHFATFPEELPKMPIQATCPPKVCAECGTPYDPETVDVPPWERDLSDIERPQLRKAIKKAEQADLTAEHFESIRALGFSDAGAGEACQTGAGRNTDEVEQLAGEAKEALGGYFREFTIGNAERTGWTSACDCETDETEDGIVLDPFAGAGTTALVGKRLGRRFIGIDLNEEYVAMAQKRVGLTVDDPDLLLESGATSLTAYTDGGEP